MFKTMTQVSSKEMAELGIDDTKLVPLTILLDRVESWYRSEFQNGDEGVMVQMKSSDAFVIPVEYDYFQEVMEEHMKIKVVK